MAFFNPKSVDLDNADTADILCYLSTSGNEYDGRMGARISSIFVIGFTSTVCTLFPVVAKRMPGWKIPYSVYLFARYFGTGVIVATAFIHLLDPAYSAIGPNTCVGSTGHWQDFSWCAAIVMASVVFIFLMDLAAEAYVEWKYGIQREEEATDTFVSYSHENGQTQMHNSAVEAGYNQKSDDHEMSSPSQNNPAPKPEISNWQYPDDESDAIRADKSFEQQIAAFLILEFGVLFHSVIIGLNLGVVADEFSTLYPVLVFHQSFEGLGIGARMSAIPFGKHRKWLPWLLCAAYGLTTPISIAIGLGVRTTYAPESKTAMIVQGVLNSISAGVLIYTGLVELLARDFLFDPCRTKSRVRLLFMVICVLFGAGIMALVGKWA